MNIADKGSIDFFHKKRCIYREIKPDNILIHKNSDTVYNNFGRGLMLEYIEQNHYESVTGDLLA